MSGTAARPGAALAGTALLAVFALSGCGAAPGAEAAPEIRVAAAADLKFALDEVAAEYEETNPGAEVSVTYGSSGTFVQQIANGAPFDLYLSADIAYVDELVEQGLAEQEDVFRYAVGRLVVWAPRGSPADPDRGLHGLTDPAVRTVAIANPEHAPYGAAAVAAMESAGVHSDLEDKLVLGENIAQAAEFVRSGNADAGVVALSLALAPDMRGAGSYTEIPLEEFPRLDQGGTVLAGAPREAGDLAGFLQAETGQRILADYGFEPPAAGSGD